jgi:hypothetical protein
VVDETALATDADAGVATGKAGIGKVIGVDGINAEKLFSEDEFSVIV